MEGVSRVGSYNKPLGLAKIAEPVQLIEIGRTSTLKPNQSRDDASKLRKMFLGEEFKLGELVFKYCPVKPAKPGKPVKPFSVRNDSKKPVICIDPMPKIIKPGESYDLSAKAKFFGKAMKGFSLKKIEEDIKKAALACSQDGGFAQYCDLDYTDVPGYEHCDKALKMLKADVPQALVTARWWCELGVPSVTLAKPSIITIPPNIRSFLNYNNGNREYINARLANVFDDLNLNLDVKKLSEEMKDKIMIVYTIAHEFGHAVDSLIQQTKIAKLSSEERVKFRLNQSLSYADEVFDLKAQNYGKEKENLLKDRYYIKHYEDEKFAHDYAVNFIQANLDQFFPELLEQGQLNA